MQGCPRGEVLDQRAALPFQVNLDLHSHDRTHARVTDAAHTHHRTRHTLHTTRTRRRTDPVLAARMQEFLESHLTFHPLEKAFHQLLQQYIAAVKPTDPLRRVVITPRVHSAAATATAASTAPTEGKENDKEKGKEKESGEKSDEGEPEAGGGEGPNWRVFDLHKTRHVCACVECCRYTFLVRLC